MSLVEKCWRYKLSDQILPLIIAMFAIMTIGYLAQYFGICMVVATQNTLRGDPVLLVAVLFSGAWVWFYVIAVQFYHWDTPFKRYDFHFMFVLGGLLLGFGSGMNQGCSVSTMNQLAKGHLGKIATMMGWFIGWVIWQYSQRYWFSDLTFSSAKPLSIINILSVGAVVSILFIVFFIKFKPSKKLFMGVSLIGLLASLLYYVEPLWQPSALINDLGNEVFFDGVEPSGIRIMIVMGLMVGMWLAVAVNHDVRVRLPKLTQMVRYIIAGTLMGVGASMALGGNDAQILLGIPSISIGAFVTLTSMILGIVLENWVYALLHQNGLSLYRKQ